MANTIEHLNIPMSRLPRAADRATHAWQAHRGKETTLDAQGATMAAAAEQFRASQTAHQDSMTQAALKRAERTMAIERLQPIRRRALSAAAELPGFDTTGFNDSSVPEDVLAQAREIRARIESRTREGTTLPYAPQLLTSLIAATEAAEIAIRAAYQAETLAQQTRDDQRRSAVLLDDKLIAFRNILRTVIGSKHRDYRMLRVLTTRTDNEANPEPLEPPTTPTVTPAANDNALPQALPKAAHNT